MVWSAGELGGATTELSTRETIADVEEGTCGFVVGMGVINTGRSGSAGCRPRVRQKECSSTFHMGVMDGGRSSAVAAGTGYVASTNL